MIKIKKKLDDTCIKIPSAIPGEEVYDKNGNKLFGLFRKVEPETPGDELYDKNGNKRTYKKLDSGKPTIITDINGKQLDGNI